MSPMTLFMTSWTSKLRLCNRFLWSTVVYHLSRIHPRNNKSPRTMWLAQWSNYCNRCSTKSARPKVVVRLSWQMTTPYSNLGSTPSKRKGRLGNEDTRPTSKSATRTSPTSSNSGQCWLRKEENIRPSESCEMKIWRIFSPFAKSSRKPCGPSLNHHHRPDGRPRSRHVNHGAKGMICGGLRNLRQWSRGS